MTYKIEIEGMHCGGCEMLIKMSLEEAAFTDVSVSLQDKLAKFSSTKDISEVKLSLDKIFEAFDTYKYINLLQI